MCGPMGGVDMLKGVKPEMLAGGLIGSKLLTKKKPAAPTQQTGFAG